MSDLYDELLGDIEAANEAAEQVQQYSSYGKLTVAVQRIHWVNKQLVEVDSATYRSLPANQKQMNFVLSVDIAEFKPELTVYPMNLKYRGKEWYDTFEPSVKALFAIDKTKDELTAEVVKQLLALNGKYVRVDQVPNKGGKVSKAGNLLKSPALAEVFESREACYKAQVMRFGTGNNLEVESTPVVSNSYSDDVVNSVKMLAKLNQSASQIATSIGGGLTESDVNAILKF